MLTHALRMPHAATFGYVLPDFYAYVRFTLYDIHFQARTSLNLEYMDF
ncbi:MAG: hypothetical protein NZ455_07485 [Bacteroidia bacterium]|nr:hypothetical protein [Bacteroidia bacterium]MDW8346511.1 hypothetical protein [Bacteroidia bacterium]